MMNQKYCKDSLERRILGQVLPVMCGCFISVSFGMALGWPSIARPHLIHDTSMIHVDHSKVWMVAGFLMEGNAVGALFCTTKLVSSRSGVMLSLFIQVAGWLSLIGMKDIYGLFVSRILIGFGNGFGTAQVKRFARETCHIKTAEAIIKFLPLGINFGMLLMYILGIFVVLRITVAWAACLTFTSLFLFILLPRDKQHVYNNKKVQIREEILNEKSLPIYLNNVKPLKELTFKNSLKHKDVKRTFYILFIVIFIQQYTGGPASVIFSETIFIEANVTVPKICSVIYALFFLICRALSLSCAKNFRRKNNLIFSCAMTFIFMSLLTSYFHNKNYLLALSQDSSWTPLFLLVLFNFFHTFGLETTQILFIVDISPKNGRNYLHKFQTIHLSISAVLSTKIFQILYVHIGMDYSFAFFAFVALLGIFLIGFLVPETKPKKSSFDMFPDHVRVITITHL